MAPCCGRGATGAWLPGAIPARSRVGRRKTLVCLRSPAPTGTSRSCQSSYPNTQFAGSANASHILLINLSWLFIVLATNPNKLVDVMTLHHEANITNDFRRTNTAADNLLVSQRHDPSRPYLPGKFFLPLVKVTPIIASWEHKGATHPQRIRFLRLSNRPAGRLQASQQIGADTSDLQTGARF